MVLTDNTGHGGGVTSLDCHAENVLALSGSVDGTAKLLNTNNAKVKDCIKSLLVSSIYICILYHQQCQINLCQGLGLD